MTDSSTSMLWRLPLTGMLAVAGFPSWAEAPVTLYVSTLPLANSDRKAETLQGAKHQNLGFFCPAAGEELLQKPDKAPAVDACSDARIIARRGDTLHIVYVFVASNQCPAGNEADAAIEVAVEEKARKTAFADGVSSVAKFALNKAQAKEPPLTDKALGSPSTVAVLCYSEQKYILQQVRAHAKVTVKLASDPAEKTEASFITGPKEHWFLSADALVNGAKEVKYDADQKAIMHRNKPEQVYLGINRMWGDIYAAHDWADRDRLVLKIMISPSRSPLDSAGLGIGYRTQGSAAETASGGLMLFAGSFWTRNEHIDANGLVAKHGHTQSWRIGLSYSLDTLFGWLQ